MLRNPVGWFEIYVDDLTRSTRFYETVPGITLQELPSPMDKLDTEGNMFGLHNPPSNAEACR